jgi:hypothetical protein
MANCPICNAPLTCPTHGEQAPSLGGVARCAVQHGALWVLVHDGNGFDAQGATVDVDGRTAVTDATGLASFDPLADGTYTASLSALPELLARRFDPPAASIPGISVAKGKIKSVELVLRAKPTLVVVLAPKLDARVKLDHEVEGTIATKDTVDGIADFGSVPPGKHTITVTLAEEPAKTHAPPAQAPTVTLDHGQAKEQPVRLVERVRPVITLAKDAVAVGGDRTTVALKADRAFAGKGKLRVTAGAASIKLYRADVEVTLMGGAVEFPGIDQAGVELAIEAATASAHQGVVLEWGLESDTNPCAPAVTAKLTAVKATLTIHDAAGTALAPDVARGDGRVIHLQDAKQERARAKLLVACEPPEYAGKLVLKATKDLLALHTAAKDGEAVALPCELALPIVVDAEPPAELWVEGKAVSAAKQDTGLELAIDGLAAKADHVVITVVQTKLEVYGERPKGGDPTALGDDAKRDPGRALWLQGNQFRSPRAMVRVLKLPHDAPCTLRLRASGDELRLFPKEAKDKAGTMRSLEDHISTEKAEALPREIGPLEITDAAQGLVLWAEGAKKTVAKATLALDVDAVDEGCDTAAFTVAPAVLELEVARKDALALSDAVAVELRETQGGPTIATADVDALTGKVALEVPPGAYLVGLGPKSAEAAFRILRTGDSLEAPVQVEAAAKSTIEYELEPEPTYDKIQFVAYRITTGQYLGTDDKTAFGGDVTKAAKHDLEGRCKLMTAAVKDAYGHGEIDASDTTLKIFVAPEFYFRGMLGAYPYDIVSMVLDELRKETKDGKYAHWLFVFGSAIGSMETEARKEHVGSAVTIVSTSKKISFLCGDTAPSAAVASGWKFHTWAAVGGAYLGTQDISAATEVPSGRPNVKKFVLDCAAPPVFDAAGVSSSVDSTAGVHVGVHVDVATRPVTLRTKCTTATPLVGWGIEQGALHGIITKVTAKGGDVYELEADVKLGPLMVTGTDIDVVEPGKAEIINIAQVQKGGPGVPVNKDGSRALKELLVYKETISSVDFMGLDYGEGTFYSTDRHLAKLDGDPFCKLYPTPGSTDVLGANPNVQGQARVDDQGNPGTGTASEVTTSGLGGGSIFTMHDIAFGLEVCLDHGASRLKNYYAGGKAKSGEPKVQVQLIPSCGMSIKNPACVADGLIFNVDAHHHAAKKSNGTAVIATKGAAVTPTVPMGITITDYFPANGEIVVYTAEDTPTKATVP